MVTKCRECFLGNQRDPFQNSIRLPFSNKCVAMHKLGKNWEMTKCEEEHPYICQKLAPKEKGVYGIKVEMGLE